MDGRRTDHPEDGLEQLLDPCYSPVLALATGLVVGAELHAPPISSISSTAASSAWAGSLPVLTRLAAHAFAFGPPAEEGWWIAAALRPGQVAAPSAVGVVAELLHVSGLQPERLILQASHTELSHAVTSGSAGALAALGVRFSVLGFGLDDWSGSVLRSAPVASIRVRLAGLHRSDPDDVALVRSLVAMAQSCGTEVIGCDVESDDQLALAGDAGVALVEGYRWGSPGSLAKLVGTWARLPVSE